MPESLPLPVPLRSGPPSRLDQLAAIPEEEIWLAKQKSAQTGLTQHVLVQHRWPLGDQPRDEATHAAPPHDLLDPPQQLVAVELDPLRRLLRWDRITATKYAIETLLRPPYIVISFCQSGSWEPVTS